MGANVEVKRAIFLAGSKAPHLTYVGDSILGRGVNLGAGTVLSNFRHDGGEIAIPLGDGRRLQQGRRGRDPQRRWRDPPIFVRRPIA